MEPLRTTYSNSNSITFNCCFEPYGQKSDRNPLYASFKISKTPVNNVLHLGDKIFEHVTDIDLRRYAIRPVIGYIKDNTNIYKNAKVIFYQQYQGISSNIISDICYTDSAGMYKAYIKPGIYDIEVVINNKRIMQKNQTVQEGLTHNFYITTKAAIKEHCFDTVSFTNTDYVFIQNVLLDNSNNPIPNAEIIVFDNTYVYAFAITNSKGQYSFSLKPNNYDVIIRSNKTHAKRTNITFTSTSGFNNVLNNSNLFSKQSMISM